MKTLQQIDYYGQLLLYASIGVLILWDVDYFYLAYLLVGSWQLLSMLLHLPNHSAFIKAKQRQYYQQVLIVLVCLLVAGLIVPLLIWIGMLLFLSPVLAVWYTIITRTEMLHNNRRQLISLH